MNNKRQLPILRVVQINNTGFERYLIEDQNQRIWTGQRFDVDGGFLYAKYNSAAIDVQNILKRHFEDTQPQRYVVPLCVEVYSHHPVTIEQVAKHLSVSSRLILNTPEHGNGPDDSLVLPWIEWHRIKQIEVFPND
jgi:hypothetical protein